MLPCLAFAFAFAAVCLAATPGLVLRSAIVVVAPGQRAPEVRLPASPAAWPDHDAGDLLVPAGASALKGTSKRESTKVIH